jgi:hypothetical protein
MTLSSMALLLDLDGELALGVLAGQCCERF